MIAADSVSVQPNDLMALEPGDVHLWFVRVDEVADPAGDERDLSADERERAAAFVFARDRVLYRAAHRMVRSVLSHYAAVSPGEWRFAAEAAGKPRILGPQAIPALRFNLSHTHGLAVVAVVLDDEIGVDVERIVPPRDPGLAQVCFTPEERVWLEGADEPSRFYELWTLKEAYLKARGLGLSLPLQGFQFRVEGANGASIAFVAEGADAIDDDPTAWQFQRIRVTPQHAMAVALRRPPGQPMRKTLHEWRAACSAAWMYAGVAFEANHIGGTMPCVTEGCVAPRR